jgi:hypothetical protein
MTPIVYLEKTMNEKETKNNLINEYRKIFCKFAECKIVIPESLIEETERDFSEQYKVDKIELHFLSYYKDNYGK